MAGDNPRSTDTEKKKSNAVYWLTLVLVYAITLPIGLLFGGPWGFVGAFLLGPFVTLPLAIWIDKGIDKIKATDPIHTVKPRDLDAPHSDDSKSSATAKKATVKLDGYQQTPARIPSIYRWGGKRGMS